jgi:Zn-dependent protease with chaperone function
VTTVLPEDQRLVAISPRAFEHPADRAATAALHSVPMLDTVVRKLIELGYETSLRQTLLAASVKLGDDQLPGVWADYRAALARLDMPEVYDLYITQFPLTNAAAIGSGKPIIVLTSESVELFDELELRTVLGHEVGHVLADHVLYMTALEILLALSLRGPLPSLMGLPLLGVKLALLEWFRAAELTSDRAATLVTRDPMATCRTLMVIAAGAPARRLNLDAFVRQAVEYEDWDSGLDRLRRLPRELGQTHPVPVRRVREVMRWVQGGDYDRIMGGEYVRRGQERGARDEASDAFAYYSERFRSFFADARESVSSAAGKAGDQVADAAGKLSDWLKQRGS